MSLFPSLKNRDERSRCIIYIETSKCLNKLSKSKLTQMRSCLCVVGKFCNFRSMIFRINQSTSFTILFIKKAMLEYNSFKALKFLSFSTRHLFIHLLSIFQLLIAWIFIETHIINNLNKFCVVNNNRIFSSGFIADIFDIDLCVEFITFLV